MKIIVSFVILWYQWSKVPYRDHFVHSRSIHLSVHPSVLLCFCCHHCISWIPYSGKFSLGSYFRDFADRIRSRENKNRNNLFQQKIWYRFTGFSNVSSSSPIIAGSLKGTIFLIHSREVCIFTWILYFCLISLLVFVYCTAQLDRIFVFRLINIQTFTACVAYGTL